MLVSKRHSKGIRLSLLFFIFSLSGCLSWYQRNYDFMQAYERGQFKKAAKTLEKKEDKITKGRHRLLYHLNMGTVKTMQGDYEKSNFEFEQAYRIVDDYAQKVGNQLAGFLVNPNYSIYYGEDHEQLFINYYMAFNYLKLGKPQSALVECKRMNIKLNALSDKYKRDNIYKEDALMHMLMGIIYESNGEYNDAFIAYRNAYRVYEEQYKPLFGTGSPKQLKQDLIRSAYLTGFTEEARQYEEQFGMDYQKAPVGNGDLVVLWHNGMSPIKEQWAITFIVQQQGDNGVVFVNNQLGLTFSHQFENSEERESQIGDLSVVRVAFPRYLERPTVYKGAKVEVSGQTKNLEMAEPVNDIAFHNLEKRMLLELGKALVRFAVKKASELSLKKENEAAGSALSVFNALTEQADTRSWQTLPHEIQYTRVSLPPGKHQVHLKSSNGQNLASFPVTIRKGQITYQTHHTLDAGRGLR